MSENGDSTINDLMKKVIIVSKNIKTLTELIKNIDAKINQPKSNNVFKNKDDKEKMDKIFEKKGLGRPKRSFEDKQKQYVEMLNKGRIKQPKEETIEYYKLFKNEEGKYEIND